MTISDINKIDMIGYREQDKTCSLGITDHLDWSDVIAHEQQLQDKINVYVNYIASGEADDFCALHKVEHYKIIVYFKFSPPTPVSNFLSELQPQIDRLGNRISIATQVG